jgi:hypothetical protein
MALSGSNAWNTVTPLGGRVSDIFADIGVQQAGALKAKKGCGLVRPT